MGDYFSDRGFYSDDRVGEAVGFWERLHPGIRSALILWTFPIGIAVINSLTGRTSVVFCYPVQLILYMANGALVGHFALGSGYHPSDLPGVGAIAGFVAWIVPTLFYLVFDIILGLVTLGIGFLGIAVWLLCGPIDLVIQAISGAIGGWLYGRFTAAQESHWYG